MTEELGAMIVVVGVDVDGRRRAARFPISAEDVVRRAAKAMAYQAIVVTTPEGLDAANGLRDGRLYRTWPTFAPVVRQATYDALASLLPTGPTKPER